MKNTQVIKLFLVILVCTSFVVSFSTFGAFAYGKLMNGDQTFPEGTTITQIDISGKTEQDVLQQLREIEQDWASDTKIHIHFKELREQLELSAFELLLEETVKQIVPGQDNLYVVQMSETAIEDMQILVGTDHPLNKMKLTQALISLAAQLKTGIQTVNLEDYLMEPLEEIVVSKATVSNQEQLQHLQRWAAEFPTIEIGPNDHFSILELLEAHGEKSFPNETLSTVATAIYETVLSTNFKIIERHLSREFPLHAREGFEAMVDRQKELDLIIMNPNDHVYTIESTLKDGVLHLSLIGPSFLYTYQVVLSEKETVQRKTIVQFDPLYSRGQKRTTAQGKDGFLITVSRHIIDKNGTVLEKEFISEDYYQPIHRIERWSLYEEEPVIVENEEAGLETEQPNGKNNDHEDGDLQDVEKDVEDDQEHHEETHEEDDA